MSSSTRASGRGKGGAEKKETVKRARVVATVLMGMFIPLASLALSHVGGSLLQAGFRFLGAFSLGLMGCVLAVSLSHLAEAVRDITRSPRWASWLLAVAFDLCLVLGELTHVSASEAGLGAVVTALMCAVCLLSMFLNCWAFLAHKGAPGRPRSPRKREKRDKAVASAS
jgi:hypothetical protein